MNKIVNLNIVAKVLSKNLFIVTFSQLVCVTVAIIYSEEVLPFLETSVISLVLALVFYYAGNNKNEAITIQKKDAYFTVTLSWVIIVLIGCLPYILSGAIPSFVNAFFESVSGFTTTGGSILTEIESLPKSILFWRSLTHWIGGIGIIVLVIIVMPSLQIGSYQLFTLESSLQDKIQSKIKSVGKRLLLIYILLTIAEVFFLLAGKMNLFESLCHAFGTIATGGFSPRNTSISGYSPYIQYVIMVFMALSGTNFAIYYYLYKKNFKKIGENEELKFYYAVIVIIGLILTFSLYFNMNKPFEESFREAFFHIITIITCTGYATADYLQWPAYAWMILFAAMFLGGSTGSTAGGIKMVRHLLLLKNIKNNFRKSLLPNAVIPIRLNKNVISEKTNSSILTFIFCYLLIFAIGSLSLIMLDVDGETATGAVATCMAGIGVGTGAVGPAGNFAHLPDLAKIILSFLMLLGRLEIYTILILFTRDFWKN